MVGHLLPDKLRVTITPAIVNPGGGAELREVFLAPRRQGDTLLPEPNPLPTLVAVFGWSLSDVGTLTLISRGELLALGEDDA